MGERGMKIGMAPSHPGSFVRVEVLEELGLSVAQAADRLGVHRSVLSDLVDENTGLSPEVASRIEKVFGVSVDMLMRMEAWRKSHAVKHRTSEIDLGP